MRKKLFSMLLSVCVVLTLLPGTAFAASESITSGGTYDLSVYGNGSTVTISTTEAVTLMGDANAIYTNLQIWSGVAGVTLTLQNVKIDDSDYSDAAALSFTGAGNTLRLKGENTLKSGTNKPGIWVGNGTSLTITEDAEGGSITAKGGRFGAGIGGSDGTAGGTITIGSGTVTALGGEKSAGIGGGSSGNGGMVTISGGTVTASGGAYGAGIGGGSSGAGGTVTISGGTVTAVGGEDTQQADGTCGTGIGGGGRETYSSYAIGAGTAVITGGSVNASSMQATPTNGTANGGQAVSLVASPFEGISANTAIIGLFIPGAAYYGTHDLNTGTGGKLFLWLPDTLSSAYARTASAFYEWSINAQKFVADVTAPSVLSVSPAGEDAAASGSIVVTFNEPMDTACGSVSLDGGTTPLGGSWNDNGTVYTAVYTALSYAAAYTFSLSGFQDAAGNTMSAYSGGFTTEAEPLTPSVSPDSLTVYKGSTGSLTLSFGRGSAAATGASLSVSDNTIASVSSTSLSAAGTVTISGLSVGTARLTVVFTDSATTTVTIPITVLAASSSGGTATKTYLITATAGTGGSISPSGSLSVAMNGDKTFTVTAADGYEIADVLVDGVSVGLVNSYYS